MFAWDTKEQPRGTTRASGGSQAPASEPRRAEEQSVDWEQKTTEVAEESPGLGRWRPVEWEGQTQVQRVGMGVNEPLDWAVCPGPQAPGTQWWGPLSGRDPEAQSSPGPREDASEGLFGEMCPEGCDGEKWGAHGCPACGVGPQSALWEGMASLPFPEEDPMEAAAPRGITGSCAPHSPGVRTREQEGHVRGCARLPGPRAVVLGKHPSSGECASLDRLVSPPPKCL